MYSLIQHKQQDLITTINCCDLITRCGHMNNNIALTILLQLIRRLSPPCFSSAIKYDYNNDRTWSNI